MKADLLSQAVLVLSEAVDGLAVLQCSRVWHGIWRRLVTALQKHTHHYSGAVPLH